MVVEMSPEASGPAGAAVEKTVTISGGNKTLDGLLGKTEIPAPEVKEKPVVEPPAPEKPAIKPMGETKTETEKPAEKTETTTDDKSKGDESKGGDTGDTGDAEDEDIDLSTLTIDSDGQSRTVQELINERDILKKQFDEIAKDEFLKGFIEHYMTTGNASAYLEAKGVDWDKKDDVEVLRSKYERDNSDLDPKIREKLWRRKLADEYKIRPDLTQEEMESEDYEIAQGLLKRDANKARSEFKETQKKFSIVDRKQEEKQPQQKFDPQAYKQQLLSEKEIDSFMKSKLLKLGIKNDSGQAFGYEPSNPEQIIEMMVDDRKFWGTFYDPKTKAVDRAKQARIYAFATNPDEYDQQLVDFGKNLGLEERLKEVKNTDGRLDKKTSDSQTKETSFSKKFLTEALKQKK
jgi:hypothetical protein